MQELGRGMRVFEAAPVRGRWRTFRTAADVAAAGRVAGPVVAVVRDPGAVWLATLGESLAAVVCTTGTPRSHVGIMAANLGVPCVVAASVDPVPDEGAEVEVDCSGHDDEDGVIRG